jgi:hypothetical protein
VYVNVILSFHGEDDDIKPIKFRSVVEVENVETLILVVYIISET